MAPVTGFGQTTSIVDTLPSGELMLVQQVVLSTPVSRAWLAYTTEEDWRRWVAPKVDMDIRVNGTIRSQYDTTAQIGDKGTIVLHILNYIPEKMITMQADLAENFPDFVKEDARDLYSVVLFERIDGTTSRVTQYGIGYKNEPRWHELLKFFIRGNEWTLNRLKEYLED